MSQWDPGWKPADQFDLPPQPGFTDERPTPWAAWYSGGNWSAGGWNAGSGWNAGQDTSAFPITDERDPLDDTSPQPAVLLDEALANDALANEALEDEALEDEVSAPWARAPYPGVLKGPDPDAQDWAIRKRGRGRRGPRGWLLPGSAVAAVVAVAVVTVVLTSAHSSGQHSGGFVPPPVTPVKTAPVPSRSTTAAGPLTMAQAQSVVAEYTTVNNDANAQGSDTLLAAVETGSSYAIDAGLNQTREAVKGAPYPAFSPVQSTYFIPGDEPAAGPHWFVVEVANAFLSNPKKVTSTEYLLFIQATPGGPWRNEIEPYVLPGASPVRIAVGADGLATAVSPGASSVAVAPSKLPAVTAASLDGTGQATISDPGNLVDEGDQQYWQAKVAGGKVTDTHAPATSADGQEFALSTVGGGALVFYTDAAQVTVTPPADSALHLSVPGLYSSAQALTVARLSYLEQFAAYDPPASDGAPRIIADYSGITGKG